MRPTKIREIGPRRPEAVFSSAVEIAISPVRVSAYLLAVSFLFPLAAGTLDRARPPRDKMILVDKLPPVVITRNSDILLLNRRRKSALTLAVTRAVESSLTNRRLRLDYDAFTMLPRLPSVQ